MEADGGHRSAVRACATLVALVLAFGGALGQIGLLLHESVHVCTCAISADGEHDCECPHCRGPNLPAKKKAAPCHGGGEEEAEPPLAIAPVPCGEETGAAPDLLVIRALLSPVPVCPPVFASALERVRGEPPESPSRRPQPPEPPPPRAG